MRFVNLGMLLFLYILHEVAVFGPVLSCELRDLNPEYAGSEACRSDFCLA